ncbi:MAG TPA: CapA family protein [Burkholderiales bacterium]|nr:CapA family protein [Burkholderiales bacterium]
MRQTMLLTGDINLMNVTDPQVPFARVAAELRRADLVFSNMECCLYDPRDGQAVENEGFYASPAAGGQALKLAGIHAVGIANNVNYGEAAIKSSVSHLDELGIPHTGAGSGRAAACAPVILERNGVRFGFLQRTSVYWPTNHEAGERSTGVAVIRGHTAYQLPLHRIRPEMPPGNRPGVPPEILTWADPAYLARFREDIAALRRQADIVVASCHWGLHQEVLSYMTEIAHAAIDAGADIVMGHGPHFSLPVEVYKGKPVFYGLGSFSFHTGHGGRKHGDWVGMLARITLEDKSVSKATFRFVRHNDHNETVLCRMKDEMDTFADIARRSERFNTRLEVEQDEVAVPASNMAPPEKE